MFAQVKTVAFKGIDVIGIDVQVQISTGLPGFNIVGLPDKAVAESKERIRASFSSIGLTLPLGRIVVNLAPADIQKEGSHYDLPIIAAMLCCMGILNEDQIAEYVFLGELSLNGEINIVNGVLPASIYASTNDFGIICPYASGGEAAWASDIKILAPKSLVDLINHFNGKQLLIRPEPKIDDKNKSVQNLCFSDVKGQYIAKRAMQIAAVGGHHLLMIGPPGSGKSMLAARMPSILPPLTPEEALELTMISSIAGASNGLVQERPFRDPHYTASLASIIGGGLKSKPGEISLAHMGVLFLDELPEFSRQVLESFRQPIESGYVIIARANSHIKYPAKPQIIAAMNPCKCGYYGDRDRECARTDKCKREYQSKLSGPLLDRIDIQVEVPRVELRELIENQKSQTSSDIKDHVIAARKFSFNRVKKYNIGDVVNAEIPNKILKESANIARSAEDFLNNYANEKSISARSYFKIIKIARSIADYDLSENITPFHIKEAISYKIF